MELGIACLASFFECLSVHWMFEAVSYLPLFLKKEKEKEVIVWRNWFLGWGHSSSLNGWRYRTFEHLWLFFVVPFPFNIMLRVSFFPGRDRACRQCWISSFWTPSGKRQPYFSCEHLFNLFLFFIKIMDKSSIIIFSFRADAGDVGGPFGVKFRTPIRPPPTNQQKTQFTWNGTY